MKDQNTQKLHPLDDHDMDQVAGGKFIVTGNKIVMPQNFDPLNPDGLRKNKSDERDNILG